MCVSLLMVFATYAEDSTTTTEEISTLSDGSVVLTVQDITEYRTVGDFEAPSAPAGYEGYIFSGRYTAQTCTKKNALADTVTSENIGENTLAYAKFLPKEILGVRAQVTAGTQYFDGDGKANIRFVTSVDSGNYLKVGFDCVQNGNSMHGESDTVYKKLEFINQSGKIMNYTPHNVFHDMKLIMIFTKYNRFHKNRGHKNAGSNHSWGGILINPAPSLLTYQIFEDIITIDI